MPLNNTNERKIAYKKLVGKAHVREDFGAENETIASFPQMASSKVFGEAIPQDPNGSSVVTKVTFTLQAIEQSKYESDGRSTAETHAFRLLKGATEFEGQIVPVSFGNLYAPILKDADGNRVSELAAYNWSLDCAAGVLWFQNLPQADALPDANWTIEAYEYIGKYLDQVVAEGGGAGGGLIGDVQKPSYDSYIAIDAQFVFAQQYSYYLFYGHDQGLAIAGTGSDHEDGYKMTRFTLLNGGTSPRQIVVKNIGLPDEVKDPGTQMMVPYQEVHGLYEGPLTVEVKAGNGVKLNGVLDGKHRLYVPGETVTLLWDGEEWHII